MNKIKSLTNCNVIVKLKSSAMEILMESNHYCPHSYAVFTNLQYSSFFNHRHYHQKMTNKSVTTIKRSKATAASKVHPTTLGFITATLTLNTASRPTTAA